MTIGKSIKWALVILVTGLLFFLVYWFVVFCQSGFFASSSKQELIENYTTKEKEILELKSFFNSIVPNGYHVYIEFSGRKQIDLWVYETEKKDLDGRSVVLFQQWGMNPYSDKEEAATADDSTEYAPKTKSLALVKQKLKWTDVTFKRIKEMLDNANCISVASGEPAEIGFARSGMGKYSYTIFDTSIPESLKADYNGGCTSILYNDKVVLEYHGGAIGSQCFPD